MAPVLSNLSPTDEEEKYYPTSTAAPSRNRQRRRRRLFFLVAFFALVLLFLASPPDTVATPFTTVIATLKSWFTCHTDTTKNNDMSTSHSTHHTTSAATGWHARAIEHAKTAGSTDAYQPKKEDLVLSVLLNSAVEPEGFTMALFKPSHVVDASGRVLSVSSADYEGFKTLVDEVKKLPLPGGFGNQWRVKHERTSYPIDRVLIPGHEEVGVYGWSKDTDVLEEETQGLTKLPEALNTLVRLAKEAREGYTRGHRDEAVVSKVVAFTESN